MHIRKRGNRGNRYTRIPNLSTPGDPRIPRQQRCPWGVYLKEAGGLVSLWSMLEACGLPQEDRGIVAPLPHLVGCPGECCRRDQLKVTTKASVENWTLRDVLAFPCVLMTVRFIDKL